MGMKTARLTLTSARLPGLLLAIAAMAVLLSMPTASVAQAAEVTLVSNLSETSVTASSHIKNSHTVAQSFATGSSDYTLGSVEVDISTLPTATGGISVKIYSATSGGDPDSSLYTLSNPSSLSTGVNSFTAPDNTTLSASTTYFVVVANTAGFDGFKVKLASSTNQTGETGWGIGDKRHVQFSGPSWVTFTNVAQIAVKGEALQAADVVVTIAADADEVTEGTAAAFTLTRTESTDDALTVSALVTQEGEVLASASDYASAVDVTFAAGSATAALSVATDDDSDKEILTPGVYLVAGTVTAVVQSGAGYVPGGDGGDTASVTIKDNESRQAAILCHSREVHDVPACQPSNAEPVLRIGPEFYVVVVRLHSQPGWAIENLLDGVTADKGTVSDPQCWEAGSNRLTACRENVGYHHHSFKVTVDSDVMIGESITVTVLGDVFEGGNEPDSRTFTVEESMDVTMTLLGSEPVTGPFDVRVVFSRDATSQDDRLEVVEDWQLWYTDFAANPGSVPANNRSNNDNISERGVKKTWTVQFDPPENYEGEMVAGLVGDRVATEEGGVYNHESVSLNVQVDTLHPTVTITGPATPPRGTFEVRFEFSEDVTGFAEDDITVDQGALVAGSLAQDAFDPHVWTASVTPVDAPTDDTVKVVVRKDAVQDTAKNGNALTEFEQEVDTPVPEFDLHSDNDAPRGVWGNDDTIWVSEDGVGSENKIYAYNRDGTRDSSEDFDTLQGAGNTDVEGIWSDGTTMFVVDSDDDKLYAYTVSTKAHDSGKDITLSSFNDEPRGIWGNADTIWVSHDGTGTDNKIFAYQRSNGNRDSDKDFDTLDDAGNADVEGIWSDGTTMWVADSSDNKLFAYEMSDMSQDPDKDVDLVSENDDPRGVWGEGDFLYVVDGTDDKLYRYDIANATGAPTVRGPGDTAAWSATLTVGLETALGYSTDPPYGSLSPGSTFILEGETYTVLELIDSDSDPLSLKLDREIPVAFTLTIDGIPLHSGNANVSRGTVFGEHVYVWFAPGVAWSDGSTVQVSLTPYTERVFAAGEALVADTTGISDADGKPDSPQGFTYQWVRVDGGDDTDIAGATAPFYYPTADDVGKSLKVRVEFEDGNGVSEGPLTSAASAAIADSDSVNVLWSSTMTVGQQGAGAVGYSSTASYGSIADDEFTHGDTDYTVTAASVFPLGLNLGVSPQLGAGELASWRWGVTGAGLNLDEGTHVTQSGASGVRWTDHNQSWNEGDRIALAVLEVNSPATGAPAIRGTPQVGEALTAGTSGIVDGNGKPDNAQGFDYRWQRSDDGNTWTDITGATAPNYYPTDADAGMHIRVQVSFQDGAEFDEGPINSVGRVTRGNVLTATLTVGTSLDVSPGYRPTSNQGALTPETFSYGGTDYTVTKLVASVANLVIGLSPVPDTADGNTLTLVIGSNRFPLSAATFSTPFQEYAWTSPGITWTDGQTVSIAIEGDIYDATADVIVQPSTTVSVPWSATVTVGEETGGTLDGFLGSALSFFGTPFGALSDSAIDIVGQDSHGVAGVTYDSSGSGTLTLYVDVAFAGLVRLAYGADATLATTAATAGALGAIDKYDWSPHDDPGWAAGDRVAFAVVVNQNVAATGAPTVMGTPQVGEALTAVTSGISDGNGLPDDAQGFDYQWQRSDDGNAWTDITGAIAPNYYPSDGTIGQRIRVQVGFEDDDGYDEGPINSAATAAVTESATVSVPWSATVTVGEETGGSLDGFLGSALNFFGTPFGALSDSAIDIVGQDSHSVAGVTYDSGGSGTLTLYVDPAFRGLVRLAYGADATLATTAATAGAEGAIDKYDWSPHDDPGWAAGDKVAFAVVVNKNVDATGAPTITGAVAEGEVLTATTSGIVDPNGLDNISSTLAWQWSRSNCTDPADESNISGATSNTYTVGATDATCVLAVTATFKDDDGYEETLTESAIDLSEATWELTSTSPTVTEGDPNGVTLTLNITNGHTFSSPITARLWFGNAPIPAVDFLVGVNNVHAITIAAGQTHGSVTLLAVDGTLYGGDQMHDIQARVGSTVLATLSPFTVLEDEDPPVITLTAATTTVTEGGPITLILTSTVGYLAAAPIPITIDDPDGVFAGLVSESITLAAVQQSGTRRVVTPNDGRAEGDKQITFSITDPPPAPFVLGTTTSVTVTVKDNDFAPGPQQDFAAHMQYSDVVLTWTLGSPAISDGSPASSLQQWRRRAADSDPTDFSVWDPNWTRLPGDATMLTHDAAILDLNEYVYELQAFSVAGSSETVTLTFRVPPLVTNLDESTAATTVTPRAAQSFVTGPEQGGYALHSVSIHTSLPGAPSAASVSIYSDSSGNPGSEVHALTNPGAFTAGTNIFTAPENTVLSPNTTYHVVVEYSASDAFAVHQTASTSETGYTGWSIGDQHHANTPWASQAEPLRIQVNGVTVPPVPKTPRYLRALAGVQKVRLVWDTPPRAVPVTHHQYRVSLDLDSVRSADWVDIPNSATGGDNQNSFTVDTDVDNGVQYVFQVRAVNATDHSHASNAASATPRADEELLSMTLAEAGGCRGSSGCGGGDDLNVFTYGGLDYQVTLVTRYSGGLYLRIGRSGPVELAERHRHFEEMKQHLELTVGGVTLLLRERVNLQQDTSLGYAQAVRVYWDDVNLSSLPAGTTVKLTSNSLADDTKAPRLVSAWGHGGRTRLEFSEILDPMALPGPQSFSATVNGSPREVTAVTATFNKDPVSGARHENQVYLTLASPAADTDTVTVSYTPPARNPLRDIASNRVRALSDMRVRMQSYAVAYLPIAALSAADAIGYEEEDGTGSVNFVVTLFPERADAVSVDFATTDGTAVAGTDYEAVNGTLVFFPGEVRQLVPVAIMDDDVEDAGETFTLVLSNPAGASIVNGRAQGTINNSDNRPATGAPRIVGQAAVGQTLTAETTSIEDADGTANASFAYQWIRVIDRDRQGPDSTTDIAGADSVTYEVQPEDLGKSLRVRVTFVDDLEYEEEVESEATTEVLAAADLIPPLATPTNFEAEAAAHLRMALDWDDVADADSYEVQFYDFNTRTLDVLPFNGISVVFDGSSAVVDNLPEGRFWWLQVRAVNAVGASEWTEMEMFFPTRAADWENNAPTGLPVITGTVQAGETLTADTSGIADENGLDNVSYNYQWIANDGNDDANIAGQTARTYELSDGDVGKTIRVRVTFTDDAENEETLTSAATPAVEARPNTEPTGLPTITGTARAGETLTASTSGIDDADGLDNAVFSYQWIRSDEDGDAHVAGETARTYELSDGDVGKTIKVRVTFTDDAENEETLTSEGTETVAMLLWSATLTAGSNGTDSGYLADPESGAVSEDEFSLGVTTYRVKRLTESDDGLLSLSVDGSLPTPFTLHAGAVRFASEDATTLEGEAGYTYQWDEGPPDWSDGEKVEVALTVPETPLTLDRVEIPETHRGSANDFSFELHFSEEVPVSYLTLRDHAFSVTNGTVIKAQRLTQGSNVGWRITVTPDSNAGVTVLLPATTDCDATGAICTGDGRKLSNSLSFTVSGPGQ